MTFPVLLLCPRRPLLTTAREKVQTEQTSGLTLHIKGENCVFPPACSLGSNGHPGSSGCQRPCSSCILMLPPTLYLSLCSIYTITLTPHEATPSRSRSSQVCWLSRTPFVQKLSPGHSCSQHYVTSFSCSRGPCFTNRFICQSYKIYDLIQQAVSTKATGKKGCNFVSEPQLHQETGGFAWGKHNT